jgi:rod shape determining protein RodA
LPNIFVSRFFLLRQINPWIVLLLAAIASVGFLMLYSAANGNLFPWAWKQMMRFSLGLGLMTGVTVIDSRTWMTCAYPLYATALILLVGVEIMGVVGMGAQRWIDLYIIQIQPSELMKIALILALARYFQQHSVEEIQSWRFLVFPLGLVLLPTFLMMRQPDLGTAIIFILCGATLFFLAGLQWWKFALAGVGILVTIPLIWSQLYDYQKNRVLTFLNPENDPANAGYHITQSKIAIGSGGALGKGFLEGTQSHLNFLPEKQTDFIFTMFSEEFGLAGSVFLILLYAVWLMYGFRVALANRILFNRLLAAGITTIIFLYVFINMAMVMGMLPVVGVPLPLVSYGGTAMLTLLIGQGLIFSTVVHQDARRRASR